MKNIILIIAIFILTGCGIVTENSSYSEKDCRETLGVFTGDSIANFISRYQEEGSRYIETVFNCKIDNRGHNSWASWDIVGTWQDEVLDATPKFIILNIGTKDCNVDYGYPQEETKKNFVYFAKTAQENGIKLYVCNVAPADFYGEATNERITSLNIWLGEEMPSYNATVIDMFSFAEGEPFKLRPEYYSDGIHPNDIGCKAIIDYIENMVIDKDSKRWLNIPI